MEMKALMFPWFVTKSTMDLTSTSELGYLPWYVSEQGLLLEPASVGGWRAELAFTSTNNVASSALYGVGRGGVQALIKERSKPSYNLGTCLPSQPGLA